MADNKKVTVNGTSSGYNPSFQDNVTMALIQNGGVRRIQDTLQQRLDECGWSQNLRQYVEKLFRSGEATTYDDAIKIVTRMIAIRQNGENGVNGGGVPDLSIPREAADDAAEVVKREMRGVLKMEKPDQPRPYGALYARYAYSQPQREAINADDWRVVGHHQLAAEKDKEGTAIQDDYEGLRLEDMAVNEENGA